MNEFQASPFAELVASAAIVDEADRSQLPKLLNALGSINLGLIQRTLAFLKSAETLVSLGAPRVARQEESRKQSDPKIVATEILALLDRVASPAIPAEVSQ